MPRGRARGVRACRRQLAGVMTVDMTGIAIQRCSLEITGPQSAGPM